jgi:hypothetical protein
MPHLLHRFAIVAVSVVAAQSILGTVQAPIGSASERALQPFVAVALWSFFLWKLWRKPRNWGLGIGIFLVAVIVFQTHFWMRAVNDPEVLARGFDRSPITLLLSVVPLAIAAILCISLRWRGPVEPTAPRRQGQ